MRILKKLLSFSLVCAVVLCILSSCAASGGSVTFVLGNGEVNVVASTNLLSRVDEPEAPTKKNYRFIGWYTDKDCTSPFNFDTTVKSDITLYAGYTLDTEKIMNTVSEDVMKSNVKLSVVHYKRSGLGFYPCASSTGSGVIYKRKGNYYFLLTNNHVVNTADETVDKTTLTVLDCYGNASEGELLYSSADYDLAIVRFESEKLLSALEISERIPNEEETVIAVSSPKGQYNTVTFGNVKDFEAVDLEDKGELSKISFPVLWHTAVCDNGSSGGALLDTDLKLIGVNFATAHNSDGSFAFSFAVSGDKLYDFIREYEHLRNDA
jgi:uncharacterized repeat protein (TIGR02543 family)